MIDDKKIETAKDEIYEDKFLGCGEMVEAFKDEDAMEMSLKLNPYYKDKVSYLKVTINDNSYFKYTVTKVTPSGKSVGIYQFSSDNIDFLRYYKVCSQSEWDSAIDRLNVWFKDSGLRIEKL